MIESLIQDFVENGEVTHWLHQGFYITISGSPVLCSDGIIRESTMDLECFWQNKKECRKFFKEWKEKWKNQSI